MANREEAKKALDGIIKKSRILLYKPIQIAEILYQVRTAPGTINLLKLEDYRNKSKKWRDDMSITLLGRRCSSSARYQDDLFNDNAIPPEILNELGKENIRTNGAVEAYIYNKFTDKHSQLSNALAYATNASIDDFNVSEFIGAFWRESGLKRSIDKIYEIVVYSLFNTLVSALELKVEVSINPEKYDLLVEFSDFAKMIMCLDSNTASYKQDARIFRVGVTNAADRGLDMYSNWGPAIQIKHLTLDEELAEDITSSVSSDKIIIVCKSADEQIILSIIKQLGWRSRIQSIITENDLIIWYEKALRGTYADILGENLLSTLCEEIINEFPSLDETPEILKGRSYDEIHDDYWV